VWVFKGEVVGKGEQPVAAPVEPVKRARKPGAKHAAAS
jgi:small subunit ribosomal protein S3